MIFVGDDWSESHHDVELQDETGKRLARGRLPEGADGLARFHALIGEHAEDPSGVVIGIETDRGPWVASLVAAGYLVFAVNPRAASRYRDRHVISGAKSDPGDAKVLADLVRTDRHNHRPVAGDSEAAEAVKVLARAHQRLIWDRRRQVNGLRSTLRDFYPAALEAFGAMLEHPDALAILGRAPTPAQGRRLSQSAIAVALRRGGRRREIEARAAEIQAALRGPSLAATDVLAEAFAASVTAMVAVITELNRQIARLEAQLAESFEAHPDAELIRILPGLGVVLGARVLGEFGDDPNRYADAKARKNYAGTTPITITSGKKKLVQARFAGNRHLADACYVWAFCAISHSPGARRYYDHKRTSMDHDPAVRALANRLVGILHGCLRHRTRYDEAIAWPNPPIQEAAA